MLAGFETQRSRDSAKLAGKLLLVDVDADADDYEAYLRGVRVHLGKDAAEFFSVQHHIVRPFQVRLQAGLRLDCGVCGKACHHGEQERLHRRNLWAQQQSQVDSRRAFRVPDAPGAAASRALLLGKDYRAFWFSRVAELQACTVGGVRFEEMVDALAEEAAFQPLAQKLGRQNVRDALKEIAGVWAAFYANADFAELFNPAPHGRTRNADFPGDARSADDNGGIVG